MQFSEADLLSVYVLYLVLTVKATFQLTISTREQRATGRIERNNYRQGSCGPSLTVETMSVSVDLHARDASEFQKSLTEK